MITVEQLTAATIAAIRIWESSRTHDRDKELRYKYESLDWILEREVRGKYDLGSTLSGRGRAVVSVGKDANHVRVEAFGHDIQVRFRESTPKTLECIFCGLHGGNDKLERTSNPFKVKFRCIDDHACDERIRSKILAGPPR